MTAVAVQLMLYEAPPIIGWERPDGGWLLSSLKLKLMPVYNGNLFGPLSFI